MKATILMALNGLGVGGAETHVVVLCKELKNMGYNIIVASNGGVYEKEITDHGIKHYNVNLNTKRPMDVIRSFRKLRNIIKDEKVDLIHAHARIPAFICNVLSEFYKVKFITTGHANFKSNFILKHISAWGQKTIVVSEDIKEYFHKSFNVPYENMVVSINGIETDKFCSDIDYSDISNEFEIDDTYKKIVLVSRVDNNLAEIMLNLIKTADKLEEKYGKVAIFIVGKGDRLEEVKNVAQEKNKQIGKKVVYVTGGRTDINKIINFSDVFIGISRAALEAMSCEKPVILAGVFSFAGILNENLIEKSKSDNFTGRSFSEVATTEALYDAIDKVLSMTDEERKEIGKLGRKIVLENYSSLKMAQDNAKVYEQVLEFGGR